MNRRNFLIGGVFAAGAAVFLPMSGGQTTDVAQLDPNWGAFRKRLVQISEYGFQFEGFKLEAEQNGYRLAHVTVKRDGVPVVLHFWQPWGADALCCDCGTVVYKKQREGLSSRLLRVKL